MKRNLALLGVLLAATFAVYLPAVDGPFLLDDLDTIADPLVVGGQTPAGDTGSWLDAPRPLATATFALNHAAVGLDTRGWHLTNMAIHLAVVVLAFLAVRATLARAGLARPDLPALAAAALFALHPLQTESVAYITQRTEALASGLYLLALWLLLLSDEAEARRRPALLAGAIATQAAGLLVKPVVATLPVAWLLQAALLPLAAEAGLPWWRRVARRLPAAAPLLALAALSAWRTLAGARGAIHAGFSIPGLSAADYLATELRAIPVYLRLALWPAGQCADWAFRVSGSFLEPAVLAGGLLLLALAAGAVSLAARARGREGDLPAAARAAAYGLLLFFVALAPSSSLVPLLDPLAEHRAYLALLGLALGAAALGAAAVRRLAGPRALLAGAALALAASAALGVATLRRTEVWTGNLAFWTDAAEKAPTKARVHLNLGNALFDAHRPAEALDAFRRAAALARDHTVTGQLLLQNIVTTLAALGKVEEARAEVEAALAVSPGDDHALAQLAHVEFVAGRLDESEAAALRSLRVNPGNGLALKYLGVARMQRGDYAGARQVLLGAAQANLADPSVFWMLGTAEEALGNIAGACAAYGGGIYQPSNPWAANRAQEAFRRLGCR